MSPTDAMTGLQLARQGRLIQALPYLDKANREAPTDVVLLREVAKALQASGRAIDAIERYRIAASLLPGNPDVLTGWAHSLLLVDHRDQARPLLEQALRLDPNCADAGGFLAVLLREAGDGEAACAVLRPLVEQYPEHPDLLWQFALALIQAEYLQEGRGIYERYLQLRPYDPLAHVALGRLDITLGQTRSAADQFKAALAIDSHNAAALWGLAQTEGGRLDQPTLALVKRLAETEHDPRTLAVLHDILARHHDRAREFQTAAVHIAHMNALNALIAPPRLRYSTQQRESETDTAIRENTPGLFHRLRDAGNADRRPVFIIGLPRSGTTLLEQMLASHPSIVGIGEQQFARIGLQRALAESGGMMEMLAPASVGNAANWHLQMLEERLRRLSIPARDRIVDKLPDNYMFAGWLSIAFPHAAIIHCLRDPRDVALSCWQTQFSEITWNLRLEHIAHRIEQHRRLMRHWRSTIGHRITQIRYEHLVADPEKQIRLALAAIHLEWHPDVLGFHEHKGFVSSASQHQVREPLHARSVERWRNYEEALQPILPRLHAIAAQDALEADPDTSL